MHSHHELALMPSLSLKKTICCFALILAFCIVVVRGHAQPLTAGIIKFPAMASSGVDGQLEIIPNQILQATLRSAQLPYHSVNLPPKRLYHQLAQGVVQIFVGVKEHPVYAGKVLYSQAIVRSLQLNIYRWGNSENLTHLQQLFGKKLGLIKGFDYNDRRQKLLHGANKRYVVDLTTHKSALDMLKNGRILYLLDYKFAVDSVLAHYPMPALKAQQLQTTDLYFIVAKSTPQAQQVMKRLEQSYQP